MISLTFPRGVGDNPALPRFNDARNIWATVSRHIRRHTVTMLQAIGLLVFGAGMLFSMMGFSLPTAKPASTTPHSSERILGPKPANQSASTTTACRDAQTSGSSFTTCPSFLEDYGNQSQGSIDTNAFSVYTGAPEANSEAEYYTNDSQNLRVQNGSLVLEARNNPENGYQYTSARISTQGKESFLYGKLVVRATLPAGIGTWPAIWMLPSDPKYASLSPTSDPDRYMNDGEIDIAEAVGTEPNMVYGIAHSLAYPEDGVNRSYFNTITVPNNDTTFHDYEVDWTPTSLTFRVDGTAFFTYNKQPGADYHSWPFDQPFYLIINLALGGTWGGLDTSQYPGDGVDKSVLPATMNVQSIAYYPYTSAH